jgi:RluA family pseudouridine synthase
LDANTTGVVVLSRTRNVAAKVQPQFEHGKVRKRYVARVHGVPNTTEFRCDAPIVPRSTQAGARHVGQGGQAATTEFAVLREQDDGTSLVTASPITGRTNQIRIHLCHLGFPIVGDQLYCGEELGDRQTLDLHEQQLCLHAHRIQFEHPENGRRVEYSAPLPKWATAQ